MIFEVRSEATGESVVRSPGIFHLKPSRSTRKLLPAYFSNRQLKFFCTLYNPAYRLKSADGKITLLGKYDLKLDKTLIVTFQNGHQKDQPDIKLIFLF
jgi:hypothetical protein